MVCHVSTLLRQNKLEQQNAYPLKSSMNPSRKAKTCHFPVRWFVGGGGGWKGCLNFLFIVTKIVAYKCLVISQIYNFMPEMLFALQEHVTCHTCIICKHWVKWLKTSTARRLVKAVWLQHYSFHWKFSFPKIKVSSLHVEDFSKTSQTQLSHSKCT